MAHGEIKWEKILIEDMNNILQVLSELETPHITEAKKILGELITYRRAGQRNKEFEAKFNILWTQQVERDVKALLMLIEKLSADELKIEIDEKRVAAQVSEITNNPYFEQLRKKAEQLRRR
ncbi:hypothetical protein JW930_00875 [Candidatus Woesearchaeota archaeon]|nr:hypothetical protein [Candidatus Woesearchaeota archaeon]